MVITLCGSMAFAEKFIDLKNQFEKMGHQVLIPNVAEGLSDYSKMALEKQVSDKKKFIDGHISKIKQADRVLIINEEKNGVSGYIGADTFLEMGFSYILGKPIFLLNAAPEQANTLEILGLSPIVLGGNASGLFKSTGDN